MERFEAKLAREHPYFVERGLSPELIAHFGLGYYPDTGKGMMRNRVVIPIHNDAGEILAYAGRWVGRDEDLLEGKDKYQLPKGFHKRAVLFNLHRVAGRRHLVLVEGFLSVFRLHQLGVPAAALMGRVLFPEQLSLLEEAGTHFVTVLLDGDEAGRSAAPAMMELLARSPIRAKFAVLPDGTEPDTAPEPVLRALLGLS